MPVGLFEQPEEDGQVGDDLEEADQRVLAEGVEQPAAGLGHALAAEALAADAGQPLPQGPDQVRPVQVAARLAGADEQSHAGILATQNV